MEEYIKKYFCPICHNKCKNCLQLQVKTEKDCRTIKCINFVKKEDKMKNEIKEFVKKHCINCKEPCEKGIVRNCHGFMCVDKNIRVEIKEDENKD